MEIDLYGSPSTVPSFLLKGIKPLARLFNMNWWLSVMAEKVPTFQIQLYVHILIEQAPSIAPKTNLLSLLDLRTHSQGVNVEYKIRLQVLF